MRHSPTLFTAVLLLLFLGGIHVAQGDDQPTSKDLGRIQPPGGVPLPVVGPEGQYTVDGLNKVGKRLEAVPRKDLEKWIVELERIMDIKLKDGLPSARQTCRTDFVIHMSVAFDDLKWNAKAAEKVFQRAQTMLASEAKVWKEAFEALWARVEIRHINQQADYWQAGGRLLDGLPAEALSIFGYVTQQKTEGQVNAFERRNWRGLTRDRAAT